MIQIDGQHPQGLCTVEENWEIASLTIIQNGQEKSLPIDHIKHCFNPVGMHVSIGLNGELYIEIGDGSASDYYRICLSVVNGIIRYATPNERC
jgi:hypothetical protein